MILSETHLHRLLRAYLSYYNTVRPHQALEDNSPRPRDVQPPGSGGWWRSRRSAGSIITTSARPDHDPSPGRRSLSRVTYHAACRGCDRRTAWPHRSSCAAILIAVVPDAGAGLCPLTARRRIEKVGPMTFLTWTGALECGRLHCVAGRG